jgi:hypothetical protein
LVQGNAALAWTLLQTLAHMVRGSNDLPEGP